MQGTANGRPRLALAVAALFAVAGCGSDDDSDTTAKAPAESAEQTAPAALVGKYTTTLKPSDLPPNPPAELTSGSKQWTLTIANSGGIDDGPAFAIANGE